MLIKKSCKCGRNPTIVNLVPSMPQLQVLSMTLLYSVHDKSDVSRGTMYVDVQVNHFFAGEGNACARALAPWLGSPGLLLARIREQYRLAGMERRDCTDSGWPASA
jgi:hypothetical protein